MRNFFKKFNQKYDIGGMPICIKCDSSMIKLEEYHETEQANIVYRCGRNECGYIKMISFKKCQFCKVTIG